jgi:hypothetical protein
MKRHENEYAMKRRGLALRHRFFDWPGIRRLLRLRPVRIFGVAVAVLVSSPGASPAQDHPKPAPEHEWLGIGI